MNLTAIRDEQRKNPDHVQLYISQNINRIADISGSALKILMYLAERAFRGLPSVTENASVVCPMDDILEFMGKCRTNGRFTRQSVYPLIKELQEKDFLIILKCGTTNVYIINPNVAWKSSNDKKYKSLYNQYYHKDIDTVLIRGNIVINKPIDASKKVIICE